MTTVSDILKIAQLKGYKVFENDTKPYNLNIWGIRNPQTGFNDEFHIFWKYKGSWSHFTMMGTTDPGSYYLENPLNLKGTAILQEGQHRGLFKLGKHKGKYLALVQNSEVTVWRDYNKDNVLDFVNPDKGMFGINFHRAHSKYEVTQIGRFSAGCQVVLNPTEFDMFIYLCQRASWGDSFTYTLINISDL